MAAPVVAEERTARQISKPALRALKIRVAQWRKKGFDVWTDDELEREGWTLKPPPPSAADLATPAKAQAADWDCGLACVQMALLALSVDPPECTLAELRKRLGSDSVWTADLIYLLASYGAECEYLTTELGAGAGAPERTGSAFYASSLAVDSARVEALFAGAEEEGVVIRRCAAPSSAQRELPRAAAPAPHQHRSSPEPFLRSLRVQAGARSLPTSSGTSCATTTSSRSSSLTAGCSTRARVARPRATSKVTTSCWSAWTTATTRSGLRTLRAPVNGPSLKRTIHFQRKRALLLHIL